MLSFTKAGTASNIGILKVSVLNGAFAASYPNYTREALCTESFQKSSPLQQCDCELDSKGTIKGILIDEVKKSAKWQY